jgi:ATP-dependent helicase/nuclease subunit A
MIAISSIPAETAWGASLAYGSDQAVRARKTSKKLEIGPIAIPSWALAPAPIESRPPRPLAPSAIAADTESAPPPSEAMRLAARRGTLIHQLLERLPALEPDLRPAAARKWLERSAGLTDAAERDEIVEQVCGIIADDRFSALFGAGSLGEAPLAATLPDGRVIAGTIDRLLVEESKVSVIDFKTGRAPASKDQIPAAHLAQMEAYTDALKVIFPGKAIRAALLYTACPVLFELTP